MNTNLNLMGVETALELLLSDCGANRSQLEHFRKLLDLHAKLCVELARTSRKSYHHDRHCNRAKPEANPPTLSPVQVEVDRLIIETVERFTS